MILTQMRFRNHSMEYDFIDEQKHQLSNMNDHKLKFGKDRFEDLKKTLFSSSDNNPCLFPALSPVSYKAQSEIEPKNWRTAYAQSIVEKEGSDKGSANKLAKEASQKVSVFH